MKNKEKEKEEQLIIIHSVSLMNTVRLSEQILDAKDNEDCLIKFHEITNRLKKRFFRNPNVTEVSEQLHVLLVGCELEEAWQCAGMCCTSVTRCFRTLGIRGSEINYSSKAGKFFFVADQQDRRIGCLTIGNENLIAASSCFNNATKRSQSRSQSDVSSAESILKMIAGSAPDNGRFLKKLDAAFPTIKAMDKIVSFKVCHGNSSALKLITVLFEWMNANVNSTLRGRDFRNKTVITELFQLLIEHLITQDFSRVHLKVVERYTSKENISNKNRMKNQDGFLLLESLVLACQSKDTVAIIELEEELWKYFHTEEKNIMRIVPRILLNV